LNNTKPGFYQRRGQEPNFCIFPCVFEEFERYHSPSTLPLKTTRNRFPPCFRVFGVFRGSHTPCFRVFGVFRGSHTPCFRVFGVFRGSLVPCFRVFGVFRGSHTPCFRVFGVFRGSHTPCFRVLASGLYRFLAFNPDPKA
jgi:hypothetical protein